MIESKTKVFVGTKKGKVIKSRVIDGVLKYKIDFGTENGWFEEEELSLKEPKEKTTKKTKKTKKRTKKKEKLATSRDEAVKMDSEERTD